MVSVFCMSRQRGTTMIEVLVTLVVVAFGLLGLSGLQARMQVAEMEAYQRTQALILLGDMSSRIATNRSHASDYVVAAGSPVGAGMTCPTSTGTRQEIDEKEWCEALQGAGEKTVTGSGTTTVATSQGAMVGGRGCVESLGNGEYQVTIAWQGLIPISAPPASVACGKNLYDGAAGSSCRNDLCRRTVSTIVRIAPLI
jgi:type IV pilus assembly protein PilV